MAGGPTRKDLSQQYHQTAFGVEGKRTPGQKYLFEKYCLEPLLKTTTEEKTYIRTARDVAIDIFKALSPPTTKNKDNE